MKDSEEKSGWWCNSHCREATHTNKEGKKCCDPDLGGILLPCDAVLMKNIKGVEGLLKALEETKRYSKAMRESSKVSWELMHTPFMGDSK